MTACWSVVYLLTLLSPLKKSKQQKWKRAVISALVASKLHNKPESIRNSLERARNVKESWGNARGTVHISDVTRSQTAAKIDPLAISSMMKDLGFPEAANCS